MNQVMENVANINTVVSTNISNKGFSLNGSNQTVVRTNRGLTIKGTRLTIYVLMDYLKAGWSADSVRELHYLSEQEMQDVLDYLDEHEEEVEAEYWRIVKRDEEIEEY